MNSGTSRILTLVFTDLADSTALKTQRGDQAVGELITRHRAHVRRLAAEAGGRIVDWAGDGCFLTFETPSAAVLFALRLQQVHGEEPDLPGVRTGIHMGEVSERPGPDGDAAHPRVEGLAVDLAARISGLARPAQVLMSSPVADSARQRLDSDALGRPILWRGHGGYSLKGFDTPLEIREAGLEGVAPFAAPAASDKATPTQPPGSAAHAVPPRAQGAATHAGRRPAWARLARLGMIAGTLSAATLLLLVWWATARAPHTPSAPQSQSVAPPAKKSVAVLPFVNMSGDSADEYLSDGMTEEIITALSKVSGLRVAARTSSFAFKSKNEDIETIGQQLRVGTVLEGSVRKAGSKLRITTQLINVADGFHLWSEDYDRDLADVFAIESDVAQRVADALKVTLLAAERQRLEQKPTDDLEAHQLYLKGRFYAGKYTKDGLNKGAEYFRQAIAIDPNYALAYSGLAYDYVLTTDWTLPAKEAMPKAKEAATKALAIDDTLAEAHAFLAMVYFWFDWDWSGSEREFKRAIELDPNSAVVRDFYGYCLGQLGYIEPALTECERALQIDPLSLEANSGLGVCLFFARRYDEALEQLHRTIDMEPSFWFAHYWLGLSYAQAGKFPEAITELQTARQLEDGIVEIVGMLGWTHGIAGQREEATRVLGELRERAQREHVPTFDIAVVYIGLGDKDQAFEWLDKAYAERSYYLTSLRSNPVFDSLRSDARFVALLKKMGLES